MNVEQIKDLMDREIITEVIDPEVLAKMSDDEIAARYVTMVGVDLGVEAAEVNAEQEVIEPVVDEGDEPVVDEGDEE